jgi:hypothetical protein
MIAVTTRQRGTLKFASVRARRIKLNWHESTGRPPDARLVASVVVRVDDISKCCVLRRGHAVAPLRVRDIYVVTLRLGD